MRATNNPAISLDAGTAVAKNRLVAINASTGVADYCGLTGVPIGSSMDDVDAGELQGVRLLTAGTHELVADGAVTRGAVVFNAASGKISATQGTGARAVGIALVAAAADGDVICVAPLVGQGEAGA